jgi:uncharacterized protein YdhG (YjbR/CyaY superfamily)
LPGTRRDSIGRAARHAGDHIAVRCVCDDRAMDNSACDVSSYIAAAPAERHAALTAIRRLCVNELTGHEEVIRYGMPSYVRDGVVEVSFASQRHHISLYILKQEVLERHRSELTGLSVGKGVIRYRREPATIDLDVVRSLLSDTQRSEHPSC